MAHVLNLVYGSTTITLNSSSKRVLKYVPNAPKASEDMLDALLQGAANGITVTESAVIEISGANAAAIQTALNAIETLLAVNAPRRQRSEQGTQVFATYQPSGAAAAYRSEILSGAVELQPDSQDYGRWFSNFKVNVTVAWTRRPFWEANSETQLALTNGNGTATTNALNVFNCNDGSGASPNTRNNYVEIDSSVALGVIPAPLRLEVVNKDANPIRRLYLAHKAGGSMAFTHILEAEAGTINSSYGTAAAVGTTSGGTVVNVGSIPAAAVSVISWTVTDTQAGYAVSQWIRPILRFSTRPNHATINARLSVKDSKTGAVLGQGDYQLLSTTDFMQALSTVELSPILRGQTTPGPLKLTLEAKDSATGGTFSLDYIQLSPVEMGTGFVFLKATDETLGNIPGTATGGTLIYNAIDGNPPAAYLEDYQGVYQVFGGPLMLVPGVTQRFYALYDGTADAAITRQITLRAWYRPRLLTV